MSRKPIPKIKCEFCGRDISANNFNKHLRGHENHPKYYEKQMYHLDHDDLFCKFCGKECKSKNSLVQHEIRCKLNPNKINTAIEGFNKEGREAWNKGLTKETDERVRKYGASISERIKLGLIKNTGGFKPNSVRGRYKYGTYKGFYCDSSWELAFIIYCLDNNINVIRNTDKFTYVVENKFHNFIPDFIISNEYYEVKGGYDPHTKEKIEQFPSDKIIHLIDSNKIKYYTNYCINNYGKNFIEMYDRNYPSWMDNR